MKKIIIFYAIILAVLVVFTGLFLYNQKSHNISQISDKEIILLLEKNLDAKDYLENHSDYKIIKKEILTKEIIEAGRNGQNFKEVYQGLEMENDRYIKVDLMNVAGDRGLVAVVDFNTKSTIKAYGILLFKSSVNQNGQTSGATTNK